MYITVASLIASLVESSRLDNKYFHETHVLWRLVSRALQPLAISGNGYVCGSKTSIWSVQIAEVADRYLIRRYRSMATRETRQRRFWCDHAINPEIAIRRDTGG